MAKHKIITEWIELNETYLGDGPPKIPYYEAGLWVNRCQIREGPRGRYLIRAIGIETLTAPTQDALAQKIAEYAERPNVRRLVAGVESNDVTMLPRREDNPDQDVIDGTADIYQRPVAAGEGGSPL